MHNIKTVREVMSPNVLTIHSKQAFMPIGRLFFEMGIHHLPVVDQQEELIGILSASDVLRAFSYRLPQLPSTEEKVINEAFPISELMTPAPIYVIGPEDSIRQVARLFVEHKIHALPVLEDKKVIGIITATDILKTLLERDKINFI